MRNIKDFKGQVFGKLTVKEYVGKKGHNTIWKCECECGNYTEVLRTNLGKSTNSCGCSWRVRGENNARWTGYKDISGRFWYAIKNNAEKRGIKFDITIEYAWDLFLKQNNKCALSGLEIDVINGGSQRKIGFWCTASLDRINNSEGYVIGNVQWVHKLINRMKMDLPEDLFFKLCTLISKNKTCEVDDNDLHKLNEIVLRKNTNGKEKR